MNDTQSIDKDPSLGLFDLQLDTSKLPEVNLDVTKHKELKYVKLPDNEVHDPTYTQEKSVQRMATWKRIYHASNEQARRQMICTYGHGLRKIDTDKDVELMEDLLGKRDAAPPRKRHQPQKSSFFDLYQRGECWSFDGASIGKEDVHGHIAVITFVELYSKFPFPVFIRTNNAQEFTESLKQLKHFVHTTVDVKVKCLYSDMFSTYMQFVGEESVAEYRSFHGIHLRVAPPYTHSKNSFAEKIIQLARRGVRARLSQLTGKRVGHDSYQIHDPIP